MVNTATQKQIDFINTLRDERIHSEESADALDGARLDWAYSRFDTRAASALIGALLLLPRDESAPAAEVPSLVGMHRSGNTIFKVQLSPTSGREYAKRLEVGLHCGDDCGGCDNGEPCEFAVDTFEFEYAPGALASLDEGTRLSLDEAKEFGVLYGTCIRCGRTLTDENSIVAGIGPVCATYF